MNSRSCRTFFFTSLFTLAFVGYSQLSPAQEARRGRDYIEYGQGGVTAILPNDPGSPNSLEELWQDPLFNLEPDKDFAYYRQSWSTLYSRLNQLITKRTTDLHNSINPQKATQQEREEMLAKIYATQREYTAAFQAKSGPIFEPYFKKFAFDESLNPKDSDAAFSMYVRALADQKKFAELANLRVDLLSKEKEAKEKNDEEALARIANRLRGLNSTLFNFLQRVDFDYNRPEANRDKIEEVRKVGDELAAAMEEDPRLGRLCDEFYVMAGRNIDAQLAYDFRQKVLPYYDQEIARREVEAAHGHEVRELDSPLLVEPKKFDESLLDVPMDESDEFYQGLKVKIDAELKEYLNAIQPLDERKEITRRASLAQQRADLYLEFNKARAGVPFKPNVLANSFFSDEEISKIKAQFADETKKPFDKWDHGYVDALNVVILAHELQNAIRQGDEQTLAVGDKIIRQSLSGGSLATVLPNFAQIIALERNKEVAKTFLDRAIEQYSQSNPSDTSRVRTLSQIRKKLDDDNPRPIILNF
ncbi:MAG: hypothetical protein IJU03_12965 [Thermoguttaceae bacterium]|nr:hypothetical protein [Thermoguttaceae bacterium]